MPLPSTDIIMVGLFHFSSVFFFPQKGIIFFLSLAYFFNKNVPQCIYHFLFIVRLFRVGNKNSKDT